MEDHDHCPYGCEHPQPFRFADTDDVPVAFRGKECCGCCLFTAKILTVMVPCVPEVCGMQDGGA